MAVTPKIQEEATEADLEIREFFGRDTFGDHAALKPGQLRECLDIEVYPDQLKSRRGSQFNRPEVSPQKHPNGTINNEKTWDIGDNEYVITQLGTKFYYHNTLTPDNYTQINALATPITANTFLLGSSVQCSMALSGDRLYIYHPTGNQVIEWDDVNLRFTGRVMGMPAPKIKTIGTTDESDLTGKYTYGVELVYRVNDADILGSSPNRKIFTSKLLADIQPVNEKVIITIDPTVLNNNTLWTHLRLWRTKNIAANYDEITEDVGVITDEGERSELFEVALITKAELTVQALGAITQPSESNTVPAGNAFVEAGVDTGIYTIIDQNNDDNFNPDAFLTAENLEQEPMPAAQYGIWLAKRLWVSGITAATFENSGDAISDRSRNNVWYSNYNISQYGELTKPNAYIDTSRDGQKVTKLVAFERDVIVMKEATTMRIPDGDITLPIEKSDTKIGIDHQNLASFVPELGIVAITNDYKECKIYGFDHIWRTTLNSIEISRANRASTQNYVPENVSMAYANGKLFINKGDGTCDILNVSAGRGWSEFRYQMSVSNRIYTFANGKRVGIISGGQYAVELEVDGLDTDISVTDELAHNLFPFYTTHRFQAGDGAWILEHNHLSIMASITQSLIGVPYSNGVSWPTPGVPKQTAFTINASNQPLNALLNRDYRLYLKPENMGILKWVPFLGTQLHYDIFGKAPYTIRRHVLRAIVDPDAGYGDFDPFQNLVGSTAPVWANPILGNNIQETGTAPNTITETGTAPDTITEE